MSSVSTGPRSCIRLCCRLPSIWTLAGDGGDFSSGGGGTGFASSHGGGGGGLGYRRKKIDIMICCVKSKEVRAAVLAVCKSLSIPMMAVRSLEKRSGGLNKGAQGTVEFVLPTESKLFEPKERARSRGRGAGSKINGSGGSDSSGGEVKANCRGEERTSSVATPNTRISAKLEPLE